MKRVERRERERSVLFVLVQEGSDGRKLQVCIWLEGIKRNVVECNGEV